MLVSAVFSSKSKEFVLGNSYPEWVNDNHFALYFALGP